MDFYGDRSSVGKSDGLWIHRSGVQIPSVTPIDFGSLAQIGRAGDS